MAIFVIFGNIGKYREKSNYFRELKNKSNIDNFLSTQPIELRFFSIDPLIIGNILNTEIQNPSSS